MGKMELKPVFQVYKNNMENDIQSIDGRSLDDICKDDELLVFNKLRKSSASKAGVLT